MKRVLIPVCMISLFVFLASCNPSPTPEDMSLPTMSISQLVKILEEPDSSLFLPAINEIIARGESASDSAPVLAQALSYNRRDSYMAGIALIALGPNAKAAIPYLIPVMEDERASIRAYAALSLGSIGEESRCAIPQIASLLWDIDPSVRASAANAIESITNNDLVDTVYEFNPAYPNSIPQDVPENIVTSVAREWWLSIGQNIDWNKNNENCFPPDN